MCLKRLLSASDDHEHIALLRTLRKEGGLLALGEQV